jgi:SAM-dependent methyltransferase
MIQTREDELAERWRSLHETRAAQQARLRGREGDFWGSRAQVFAKRIDAPDATLGVILERMHSSDNVLDVGAGAGRYAIPIAGHVKEVVALEPSAGMGEALLREAEGRHVSNIRLIQGDWLETEAPVEDVVLCSHVLYFTPDAVPFVRKLNAHARRECIIVIRVDQGGAGLMPLYEQVCCEPQAPEPAFIELYNLLYALGVVADVQVVEGRHSSSEFESLDQAEASVTQAMAPATEESRAKIRPYLEANLVPGPDGLLVIKGFPRRVAVVSWSPV